MKIMNNMSSIMALGELKKNDTALSKSLKKVSSGMKLNSAGDGAAEYSISEKMRVRLRALSQCEDNASTGQNLLSIALGAVDEQIQMGKRLREITLEAMTDSVTDSDRKILQKEVDQLFDQLDTIAYYTEYNGKKLLCEKDTKTYVTTWKYYNDDGTSHDSVDKNGDALAILAQADVTTLADPHEGYKVPPGEYKKLPETTIYDQNTLIKGEDFAELPKVGSYVWSNDSGNVCKIEADGTTGDLFFTDGGQRKYVEIAGKTAALNTKSTVTNLCDMSTVPPGITVKTPITSLPADGDVLWSNDFNKMVTVQSDDGKLYIQDGDNKKYVEVAGVTLARNTTSTITNISLVKHPKIDQATMSPPLAVGQKYALSEYAMFNSSGGVATPQYEIKETPGSHKLSIFDDSIKTSPCTSVYELDFSKLQEAYDNGKIDIPAGLHNNGFSVECGECTSDPDEPHCPQYISVLFDATTTESHEYYGTLESTLYTNPVPNPVYYVIGVKNLDKNNIEKSLSELLYNGIKEAQKNEVFNTKDEPVNLHQKYNELEPSERIKSGISATESVEFANRHHLDLNYHEETGKLTLSKYGPIMRVTNSTTGQLEEITNSVTEKFDYKELAIQGDPKGSLFTLEKLYSTTFDDLFKDLADGKAIEKTEVIGTRTYLVNPSAGTATIVKDTTSKSDSETKVDDGATPTPPAPPGKKQVAIYREEIETYTERSKVPDENDNFPMIQRTRKKYIFDHYEEREASSPAPSKPKESSGSGNYELGSTKPTGKGDGSYWLTENETETNSCHKFDCVLTRKKATIFLSALDPAIDKLIDISTTLGAQTSRLDFTISNLTTEHENLSSAESVIRDADMAKAMTEYAKNNVLAQAAQSMLAQANQNAGQAVSLLQG